MPDILIPKRVVEQFTSHVATVLHARLRLQNKTTEQFISESLAKEQCAWVAEISCPEPGAVIQPRLVAGRPWYNDLQVSLAHPPEPLPNGLRIRIESVLGDVLAGTITPEQPEPGELISKTLLFVAGPDLTILADLLPGKDCLLATKVWPSERLPHHHLIRRKVAISLSAGFFLPVILGDEINLASGCHLCGGGGDATCKKCDSTGIFRQQEICRACGGNRTCQRCGGSGQYAPNGYVQGLCRGCNGSGSCGACNGLGHFPAKPCNSCNGTGNTPCWWCKGSGYVRAQLDRSNNSYNIWVRGDDEKSVSTLVKPELVTGRNWIEGAEYSLEQGAANLLRELSERQRPITSSQPDWKALSRFAEQLESVSGCLRQIMEIEGVLEVRPIELDAPKASLDRSANGVIYEFPVMRRGLEWVKSRSLPFPLNSLVQFLEPAQSDEWRPFDLPRQYAKPDSPGATLVGWSTHGANFRLKIQLPLDVDLKRFPLRFAIRRNAPLPGEIAQLRHLKRWCDSANFDNSIFRVMAGAGSTPLSQPDNLNFVDRTILSNPSQLQAVQLGLSNAPLSLIKGPPGTGKTTVITEIVRQEIRAGKKVLVCSQTHQAVRNVLEKLDKDPDCRMLRHGDSERLSEIEKKYQFGGASDAFRERLKQHSRVAMANNAQRLAAVQERLAAVSQLEAVFTEWTETRSQIEDEYIAARQNKETRLRQAQEERGIRLRNAREEEANLKGRLEQRRLEQEQARSSAHSESAKLQERKDRLFSLYRAKTGQSPPVIEVQPGKMTQFLEPVAWLLPEVVLSENYNALRLRQERTQQSIAAIDILLGELNAGLSQLAKQRDEKELAGHRWYAAEVSQIELRWQSVSQTLEQRRLAAEKKFLLRQAELPAVSGAADVDVDDVSIEHWSSQRIEAEQASAKCVQIEAFLSRWGQSVEGTRTDIEKIYWHSVQVFFSTCVGLGSWRELISESWPVVDLVIVDEAAHATIGETLMPVCYGGRVLLIGDEMQLPPSAPFELKRHCEAACTARDKSVNSEQSNANCTNRLAIVPSPCWMDRSFFEWLFVNRSDVPRVMLNRQFRMHPNIAQFVGTVFYPPDGLENGVTAEDRQLHFGEFGRSVCLIPTSAAVEREEEVVAAGTDRLGYRNEFEARLVERVLRKAELDLNERLSFGVITPYADQARVIVDRLQGFLASAQKVDLTARDIASVDSFQGSERDVIVVSFVRSPPACRNCNGSGITKKGGDCPHCNGDGTKSSYRNGESYDRTRGLSFVRDLRRLNVAFSRARRMLILIGDIAALTNPRLRGNAAGAEVLRRFAEYTRNHGQVLHVWETEGELSERAVKS